MRLTPGRQGQLVVVALALVTALIPVLTPDDGVAAVTKRVGCTSAGVRASLVSFVTGFNRGDFAQLDALFASEPEFEWFSSESPGQRLGSKAKRRSTLIGYFRSRRTKGDRLGLSSFGFNGNSTRHGNFEMTLRRKARGYMRGEWFRQHGKGAATCDGKTVQLIVVSLGRPTPTKSSRATARARS